MISIISSPLLIVCIVALCLANNVVVAAPVGGDNSTDAPITPSYQYDMYRNNLPTCFDYRLKIDIGNKDCVTNLFNNIREQFETQSKEDWSQKWYCHGGLTRELMTLTGVDDAGQWWYGLDDLCKTAIGSTSSDNVEKDTPWVEGVDLDLFFDGQGALNNEYGNLHNIESEFMRRGGYDRYFYIGEDPRLNDYLRTSEESYQGGLAIMDFYNNTLGKKFLTAPTASFGITDNACSETSAAMCCWSGDRQYNDNNGRCGEGDCINKAPGDNTDLCWTEDKNGDVFPYPNKDDDQANERDLHCHGISWSTMEQEFGDVNNDAKWNSLFYVSMYDHLYKRGYVDSLTDAEDFMGEQAMCGCVEDMNPVARADCTEAIGVANYTMYQDKETGLLALEYKEDSFELEFRACEGLLYDDEVTSTDFQEVHGRYWEIGLVRKTNDLSSFIYRQFLEGKTDEGAIEKYEETVVGYRFPKVNNNDDEREKVCEAAFGKKYPDRAWEKVVVEEEGGDEEQ